MDRSSKKEQGKESSIRSGLSKAFARRKHTFSTPTKGGNLSCVTSGSKDDVRRHSMSLPNGVEFNYESMEDELTCPVCLELYADPLMLPCTHNICKKCLHDINNSSKTKSTQVLECPSCRDLIGRGTLSSLPRNLALENIVIRYSEERSRSIRNSLSLDGPLRIHSDPTGTGQAPGCLAASLDQTQYPPGSPCSPATNVGRVNCELCDTTSSTAPGQVTNNLKAAGGGDDAGVSKAVHDVAAIVGVGATASESDSIASQHPSPSIAAWYCEQCRLAYCHACLAKFHPKRGVLARHHLRQPLASDSCTSLNHSFSTVNTATGDVVSLHSCADSETGSIYGTCSDHTTEYASLYCAECKMLICPLCVCDGEGHHGRHRVLAPNTAANNIQEAVRSNLKHVNNLLHALNEQSSKIECLQEITEDLHKDTISHLTRQYERLLSDLTTAVQLERTAVLANINAAAKRSASLTSSFLRDNSSCVSRLKELHDTCECVSVCDPKDTISHADQVLQLTKDLKDINIGATDIAKSYDAILKDKNTQLSFHEALDTFCTQSLATLRCLITEDIEKCPSIIPHIRSPISTNTTSTHIKTNATVPNSTINTSDVVPAGTSNTTTSLSSISTNDLCTPSGSGSNQDITSPSVARNHRRRTQIRTTAPTNKYLTTWGFTSTSFTGEPITGDASWTVTIERNGAAGHQAGPDGAMYLFGAGISCDALGIKAMVGMGERSYAVVCSGGTLCFSHNGRQEHLAQLPSLPLVLTVSVHTAHPRYTVLIYKLCPGGREAGKSGAGDSSLAPHTATLVGHRLIQDAELKTCLHPAFTVSQRVKMLFHTFV